MVCAVFGQLIVVFMTWLRQQQIFQMLKTHVFSFNVFSSLIFAVFRFSCLYVFLFSLHEYRMSIEFVYRGLLVKRK